MKLLGIGATAEVFQYSEEKIMKLYNQGYSADAVEKEFSISQTVYSMGLPTPEPMFRSTFNDREGIIYERVSGCTMLSLLRSKPWKVRKEAIRLARVHHQIHGHTVTGLPKQKEVLHKNIELAPLLLDQEKHIIHNYLDKLPEGKQLCHGDFHPDNIMIDAQPWIIDWMNGTVGHPAGDVARTLIVMGIGKLPTDALAMQKIILTMIRRILCRQYLIHYHKVSGMALAEMESWILPQAAGRLIELKTEQEQEILLKIIKQKLLKIKN